MAAALVKDARLPAAIVDLGLFFGGCGVFLWALAAAAGRSREHEIGLWNLFLLEGVAPTRVRRALLGALALEVAVALGHGVDHRRAGLRLPGTDMGAGPLRPLGCPVRGIRTPGGAAGRAPIRREGVTDRESGVPCSLVQLLFGLLVLESISILALLDCWQRDPEEFTDGLEDKQGWIRWLIVAVATSWFLVGNGIVLGYYYSVIRRNPARY